MRTLESITFYLTDGAKYIITGSGLIERAAKCNPRPTSVDDVMIKPTFGRLIRVSVNGGNYFKLDVGGEVMDIAFNYENGDGIYTGEPVTDRSHYEVKKAELS